MLEWRRLYIRTYKYTPSKKWRAKKCIWSNKWSKKDKPFFIYAGIYKKDRQSNENDCKVHSSNVYATSPSNALSPSNATSPRTIYASTNVNNNSKNYSDSSSNNNGNNHNCSNNNNSNNSNSNSNSNNNNNNNNSNSNSNNNNNSN